MTRTTKTANRHDEPVHVVGERLLEARKLRKKRQIDVAYPAGMDISQISRLESGTGPDIKVSTLGRLCIELDVSADWLLGLSSHMKRTG